MEYKVVCDSFCLTSGHKARKIASLLNTHAADGWRLAALDPVLFLGVDVDFYLVLQRESPR